MKLTNEEMEEMRLSEADLDTVVGGRVDTAGDKYASYRKKAENSRWKNGNQIWPCKETGCVGSLHFVITQGYVCDTCERIFRKPD